MAQCLVQVGCYCAFFFFYFQSCEILFQTITKWCAVFWSLISLQTFGSVALLLCTTAFSLKGCLCFSQDTPNHYRKTTQRRVFWVTHRGLQRSQRVVWTCESSKMTESRFERNLKEKAPWTTLCTFPYVKPGEARFLSGMSPPLTQPQLGYTQTNSNTWQDTQVYNMIPHIPYSPVSCHKEDLSDVLPFLGINLRRNKCSWKQPARIQVSFFETLQWNKG